MEFWQIRPGTLLDDCLHGGRHDSAEIAGNAAAGNVGHGVGPIVGNYFLECRKVAAVRHQELGPDLVAPFGDVGVGRKNRDIEDQFARL